MPVHECKCACMSNTWCTCVGVHVCATHASRRLIAVFKRRKAMEEKREAKLAKARAEAAALQEMDDDAPLLGAQHVYLRWCCTARMSVVVALHELQSVCGTQSLIMRPPQDQSQKRRLKRGGREREMMTGAARRLVMTVGTRRTMTCLLLRSGERKLRSSTPPVCLCLCLSLSRSWE